MFQLHRLLVAGAVVVGTLSLAPSISLATTGSCLVPSSAASQYMSISGSNILNDLSSDLSTCHNQCEDLRKGCNQVLESAIKCVLGSTTAELDAEDENCQDLSGQSQKSCRDSVSDSQSSLRSFLRSDGNSARNFCQAQFDSCLSDCAGED